MQQAGYAIFCRSVCHYYYNKVYKNVNFVVRQSGSVRVSLYSLKSIIFGCSGVASAISGRKWNEMIICARNMCVHHHTTISPLEMFPLPHCSSRYGIVVPPSFTIRNPALQCSIFLPNETQLLHRIKSCFICIAWRPSPFTMEGKGVDL